jgi:hypothetical protein
MFYEGVTGFIAGHLDIKKPAMLLVFLNTVG